MAWIAGAVVLAVIASGAGVYVWQHAQVTDRAADVARVQQQLTSSEQQMRALEAEGSSLGDTVATLRNRLGTLRARADALLGELSRIRLDNRDLATQLRTMTAARDRLGSKLEAVRGRLETVQAALRRTEGRLFTLAGPALADGHYVGRLLAASATEPPRVAFRVLGTVEGAAVDGPGWRVIRVAPGAQVHLFPWRGAGSQWLPFGWFAHRFNSGREENASIHGLEYSITVDAGRITTILGYRGG